MPQDVISGRRGDQDGRRIARLISLELSIALNEGSNECIYLGKPSVIKSAKYGNSNFGITNAMLGRIEQVILAKQARKNEPFSLYLIPVEKILKLGTETRSKGTSAGKVTNFSISKAIECGKNIASLLAIYFEQNVTTERFEDFDGERWVITGE